MSAIAFGPARFGHTEQRDKNLHHHSGVFIVRGERWRRGSNGRRRPAHKKSPELVIDASSTRSPQCATCQELRDGIRAIEHLDRQSAHSSHGKLGVISMSKHAGLEWSEPSEPEISVGALIGTRVDDFKGNVIGERFGKYLLVGEIAVGGMAEVFLAVHKGVEGFIKVVVIKRVLPHLTSNASFTRMFIEEARLEARLEHPNIVRTYEFGEVNGRYFTAMEYLPGEDLCRALNNLSISRQSMPIHIATGITSQLCTGLHFAHQFTDVDGHTLNLVHRDVNPANIIITYGGEVKIIDFGVAKSNTNAETVTGTIKGKVSYMPPEQVLGREVDHRADIFSAGVVLWEMLTGRPLFLRDSEAATLYAIMNAPIPIPSRIRPEIPPQLDKLVMRALARRCTDRFDTAEQMANALDDFMLTTPRYDARVLGGQVEELFGSTRAEAKRAIAQSRSLTRNISIVMKLRTEVRADLAERLDLSVVTQRAIGNQALRRRTAQNSDAPAPQVPIAAAAHSRWQRVLTVALVTIMLVCIVGGLAFTSTRSDQQQAARQTPAAIEIESTPPGAALFVAGEPTGLRTPATLSEITNKQLSVRLELPNYAPVTRTIDVLVGGSVSMQVTLTPLQGRLVVSGLPSGASIFVDEDEYIAGDVIAAVAGKHEIRVVVNGRAILQQAIDTAAGDQGWKLVSGKLVRN
jgi:eukaryotic-like serine/threonine-protein kinase